MHLCVLISMWPLGICNAHAARILFLVDSAGLQEDLTWMPSLPVQNQNQFPQEVLCICLTSPQVHWERNCKWRLIHIYKGDAHRGKKEPPAQVEEEPSGLPVWGLKASANFWYSLKWQQECACVQGLMSLRETPSHTALGSPIYGEHPGPVLTALVPGNPAAFCELPFKVTFWILQSPFEPYKIIGQRQMTKGTITSWSYHSPSQDTWDNKSSHHRLCHMSTRGKEQAWSPPTI